MIIMYKWLHYWLEQSYYVQIFEDIFSIKIQFDCSFFQIFISFYKNSLF